MFDCVNDDYTTCLPSLAPTPDQGALALVTLRRRHARQSWLWLHAANERHAALQRLARLAVDQGASTHLPAEGGLFITDLALDELLWLVGQAGEGITIEAHIATQGRHH